MKNETIYRAIVVTVAAMRMMLAQGKEKKEGMERYENEVRTTVPWD